MTRLRREVKRLVCGPQSPAGRVAAGAGPAERGGEASGELGLEDGADGRSAQELSRLTGTEADSGVSGVIVGGAAAAGPLGAKPVAPRRTCAAGSTTRDRQRQEQPRVRRRMSG